MVIQQKQEHAKPYNISSAIFKKADKSTTYIEQKPSTILNSLRHGVLRFYDDDVAPERGLFTSNYNIYLQQVGH